MIKLTQHAKQRYAQRIMGIEDEKRALEYVNDNDKIISFDLWTDYSKSKYLNFKAEDKEGGGVETSKFFLYENIVFVTNQQEQKIFTVYTTDWNYKDPTERFVISELSKSVRHKRHEISLLEKEWEELRREVANVKHSMNFLGEKLLELESIDDSLGRSIHNIKNRIKELKESSREGINLLTNEVNDNKEEIINYFREKVEVNNYGVEL